MVTLCLFKSFLVNLSLSLIKLLGAFLTKSKTLMSDAVHSLSDMTTDIVGLIGSKLSSKKPDINHPFGHGRIEYLTSIIMSILIIILGFGVLINSFNGKIKELTIYSIITLVISIITKLILSTYLIKKGKTLNSNILKSNGIESRCDAYSSSLALVFVLLAIYNKKVPILKYADLVGGVIMSIFTIRIGIKLLSENISSIIGEVEVDPNKIEEIRNILIKNKNIKIRRISLLKYGIYVSAIIDIYMDASLTLKEVYETERKIKKDLKTSDKGIRYVTVNIKPRHTTLK